MRQDVVAVIPAYDCAASIGPVVEGVRRHLARVLVVDDGSRDGTAAAAALAGAQVERLPRNAGKGAALLHGIRLALAADPRAVLLLDGDGQHDPADVPGFLAGWDAGAGDLLVGSRMAQRATIPAARYWTNRVGSLLLSWLTGWRIADSQSGYRLLGAELLRRLPLEGRGYAVESEMLIKAARRGARFAEVPIRAIYEGGPSHFRPFSDTVQISLWTIYWSLFDRR